MAKTQPIGVRFDKELLESFGVMSAQKALNLYEKSYKELIELKDRINKQVDKQRKENEIPVSNLQQRINEERQRLLNQPKK